MLRDTPARAPTSNLQVMADMKHLSSLAIAKVPATDFTPLKNLPLTAIRCDLKTSKQYEVLNAIPTLGTINGKLRKEVFK